jgi:hypothetical protein
MKTKIDIYSKGSVINHLFSRLESNQIMQCAHLQMVNKGYWEAECSKEWAEHQPLNPTPDITGYGGAYDNYNWPICIKDCPHYQHVENFIKSLENEPSIESTLNYSDAATHNVKKTYNLCSIVKRIVVRFGSFWVSHWKWIIGTLIALGVLVVMTLNYIKDQQP